MDHFCNGGSWWEALGGIFMFAIWMIVVFGMMWIFRTYGHGHHHYQGRKLSDNESPLDIAKSRYAKGEINKTEFDRIKKDIV